MELERPVAEKATAPGLQIGGLERVSSVDWPGRLAATVYCQGCGWRCRYCSKPHLMPFRGFGERGQSMEEGWDWSMTLGWLRGRRGLLDAVVFSGGEPTLQSALGAAMRQVRELGFRVGLHTGGPLPERLAEVLPLLDWVGFDFKAPFRDYLKVTARTGGEAAEKSLRMLRASGVEHEVRTTWHPSLLSAEDLGEMADALAGMGESLWVLQRFRPEGCGDAGLRTTPTGSPPAGALGRAGLRVVVR